MLEAIFKVKAKYIVIVLDKSGITFPTLYSLQLCLSFS